MPYELLQHVFIQFPFQLFISEVIFCWIHPEEITLL